MRTSSSPWSGAAGAGPTLHTPTTPDPSLDQAATLAEDEPNAQRIDAYTRDLIVTTPLTNLAPDEFENFVAALLHAMGYRARATQYVGDGGVDVIAHRDPLGLEPPILKVQCKRPMRPEAGRTCRKFTATLFPGGAELGLSLGAYSKDAIAMSGCGRTFASSTGSDLWSSCWRTTSSSALSGSGGCLYGVWGWIASPRPAPSSRRLRWLHHLTSPVDPVSFLAQRLAR